MPHSEKNGFSCPVCDLTRNSCRVLSGDILTVVLLALGILLLFLATLDSARYGTETAAQAYFGSLVAVWHYPPEWPLGTWLYRIWLPLPGGPLIALAAIANLLFSGFRRWPGSLRSVCRTLPLALTHIGVLGILCGYAALLSGNGHATQIVIAAAYVTVAGCLLHYLPRLFLRAARALPSSVRGPAPASRRLGRGWVLAPLAGVAVGMMLSISNGPQEMGRIYVEKHMDLLPVAFYGACLLLLLLYFARRGSTRLYQHLLMPVLGGAVITHSLLPVCLTFIRERPPATDLHSTLVLAGWLAALIAYWTERRRRDGIGAAAAILAGAGTLLIAAHIGTSFDSPANPMTDSTFWLILHVVTISAAYGAVLLSVVLADVYLAVRALRSLPERFSGIEGLSTWLVRLGLALCCAGTLAGGLWAERAWGRFWGWDPKENSALMLILCCALVLHVRRRMSEGSGTMRLTSLLGLALAWSWAGTNLLGAGLHSYGFARGGAWLIGLYALVQTLLAILPYGNRQRMESSKEDGE